MRISTVSFGAWAIGGTWGATDDRESLAALNGAIELGVNFIDTADVYGDGHSEQLIAQLRHAHPRDQIYVATKAGRRLPRQTVEGYSRANLTLWIERSLKNLNTEAIDLLQLHCPPSETYNHPKIFGILDDLVTAGKLRYYGVSVETVAEALDAIRYPNVQSVQIIFNMFRHKPIDQFFEAAKQHQVGILARVPLASGLLTGKMTGQSTFSLDDHRNFNRNGESFDKGETFSGVPFDQGLAAVNALKQIKPDGMTMAQFALRWILMFEAVTCTIPGAKRLAQENDNAMAAELPELSQEVMDKIKAVYDKYIRAEVHAQW